MIPATIGYGWHLVLRKKLKANEEGAST